MTDDQFYNWLETHTAAFGLERFLATDSTKQIWYSVLKYSDADCLHEATRQMAGDEARPKFGSEHPAYLKRLAAQIGRDRNGGSSKKPETKILGRNPDGTVEVSYACAFCRDSGWVEIWTPKTYEFWKSLGDAFLERIRDGLHGSYEMTGESTLRCSCHYGGTFGRSIRRYDPSNDRRKVRDSAEDSLVNWRKYQRSAPVARDEFSDGGFFEEQDARTF